MPQWYDVKHLSRWSDAYYWPTIMSGTIILIQVCTLNSLGWWKGFIWNPPHYHHQIFSHCWHTFPCVCLRWLYHRMLSSVTYLCLEHWDFVSIIDVQYAGCANDGIGNIIACASCYSLFAHISLSSLYILIWRHWTSKMLVKYMQFSLCLRLSLFSQLYFIQYMGLCVFRLPNYFLMTVK